MSGRARTAEAYVGLVEQVIDELLDMVEAARFDYDEVDPELGYVELLLKEMRAMRASMADGSYHFGRTDLPVMRIVKLHSEKDLPCIRLFYEINRTHREGLDIDGA